MFRFFFIFHWENSSYLKCYVVFGKWKKITINSVIIVIFHFSCQFKKGVSKNVKSCQNYVYQGFQKLVEKSLPSMLEDDFNKKRRICLWISRFSFFVFHEMFLSFIISKCLSWNGRGVSWMFLDVSKYLPLIFLIGLWLCESDRWYVSYYIMKIFDRWVENRRV